MDIFQKLLQIEDETGGDVSNLRRLINSGQLTTASNIPQPDLKESVREIELFNRFNRDFPNYADGGRTGFKKGSREDLKFENITRLENAKINQVPTRNASAFRALPGYDNITYTDFRNKETGEITRKYNVRVRVQDKNVQKIGTTADKYKNIDTLEEALELRDQFRLDNPKNIKPLDKEKQKITKDTRRADIKAQGGVEDFLVAEEGSGVQKGHAQNIKNPDVKIKPSNIIYTPTAINEAMAGKGDAKALDLDFKIREAENKIKKIKNSRASAGAKKKLLAEQDNLLMKYVAQSDGFKTATLSDGNVYGEVFQKSKSMDMFDVFPNMTEKEAKTFVRKYITEKGDLKPFYKRKVKEGTLSDVDKANIQKSKIFLENVELAKQNAKQVENVGQRLAAIGCPGKAKGGRVEFNLGGSPECITRGLENLRTGNMSPGAKANARQLVKNPSALRNFTKFALGPLGIPTEIAIGGFFAATDYATGANKDEIISNLTFGGFGKSMEEQAQERNALFNAAKNLDKTFSQYLANLDKEGKPLQGKDMRGMRKKTTYEDVVKAMEPFQRVNPQLESGQMFDLDMFDKAIATPQELQEEKTQRALDRGFYKPGDRSIDPFQAADGGIAGLSGGVKSGPAPESGPTPHGEEGLPGILKRVKK